MPISGAGNFTRLMLIKGCTKRNSPTALGPQGGPGGHRPLMVRELQHYFFGTYKPCLGNGSALSAPPFHVTGDPAF